MDPLGDEFRPRESLRRALVLGIGVPLLIAFVVMTGVQFTADRELLVGKVRGEILADTQIACLRAEADLQAIEHSTELQAELLRAGGATFLPLESPMVRSRINILLSTVLTANPYAYGAAFAFAPGQPGVDADGFAPYVCRSPQGPALRESDLAKVPGYEFERQPWFLSATPSPNGTWSEPYYDAGGGGVFMTTYAARFRASGDLPSGVATADVSLDCILEGLARSADGKICDVSVVSRDGRFIASSIDGTRMKQAGDFPAGDIRREILDAARRFRTSGKEFAQVGPTSWFGYRGTRVVCVALPSAQWVFAGTFDEADLLPPIVKGLALGPGLLVAGAFVVMVIVWRTTGRAVRPLAGIISAIARFGQGDLDARAPVPARRDEIGTMARAFNAMGDELRGAITQREKAVAERTAVEAQVEAARVIQRVLLPAGDGPQGDGDVRTTEEFAGLSIAAMSVPATDIAGDFFDWFQRDDGTVVVVVADVCGKGMPAAMLMAVGRTLVRMAAAEIAEPGDALARVSKDLVTQAPQSSFTTAMLLYIDPSSGLVRYANAGHPPAVLVRADGVTTRELESTGSVLGLDLGIAWETKSIELHEGDDLVLVSDGVTEAGPKILEDAAQLDLVLFGEERTRETVASACRAAGRSPITIMEALVRAVRRWSHDYQRDDLTVVAIRRNARRPW
ncbi:MAG: HAMP domain-containing protein [Phycisphaerales bacterium]|nr:HAMP domain-containing protein [Phycisphaerales bacterium]